jgi:hypothetical protein
MDSEILGGSSLGHKAEILSEIIVFSVHRKII